MENMKWKRLEVFLEFLIFGVVVGVVEDIIAVKITTGEPITLKIVGIIVFIAIPFAILGEILVDQVDFVKIWRKFFGAKNNNNQEPKI